MSHFGDFMDGVPVKISEKYKRPPRMELHYSVTEIPLRAQYVVDSAKYCSTFEKNVLGKIKELRSAKETKKNERKHRLQLLQEAKQKKLDALAVVEEEERLKQLSVSEVSYPSTDEISALSPDEKLDKNCDITAIKNTDGEVVAAESNYPACSNHTDSQMNILQPIQVKSINHPEASLLDDPILDPLQNLKLSANVKKVPYSHNVETLTFKDFEQDTSSPFDNVELKTINEMELLAQVLQNQRASMTSCNPHSYIPSQAYDTVNCGTQISSDGVTYLPSQYMEHPIQSPPNMMYASPQHYPSNGYYTQADMDNMYMQNYQYYVPNNYPIDPYYNNQHADEAQMQNGASYIPQPYYYDYSQVPIQYQQPMYSYKSLENNAMPIETQENEATPKNVPARQNVPITQNMSGRQDALATQNTIVKSRSRSVPDIVNELNDEIILSRQRANERSCNPSPTPKLVPQPSSSSGKNIERRHRRKHEQLPNPYEKLSVPLQNMCQKIHGMGFPLDRVARICTLVGDSDKKVSWFSIYLNVYVI